MGVTLALLVLVLVIGIPLVQQAMDPYGGRILSGVSAAGIPLEGMSKKDAAQVLNTALGMNQRHITLSLPGKEMELSDAKIHLDTSALIKDAYAVGRTTDPAAVDLSLAPYLTMDEAAIRTALETAARELAADYTPFSYHLDGALPDLSEDSPTAPLPDLLVTAPIPAYELDVEAAWGQILESIAAGKLEIDLSGAVSPLGSEMPDVDAIYEAVSRAPVDARMEGGQAIPGSYGVSFDQEELETLLQSAAPGELLRLPLEAVTPEISGREVYFQDVLGFCQTPHSDNEKRNTNLQLACQALNGVVLEPGETLSYNATLGQRTKEAGYQDAPAYSGTRLIDTLGGGICQVSSTLYLCSLYAELETVDRVSHGFPANYMPVGLDATVSWGAPDLKIKNSSDYPVKIIAETCDGFVRVWIMGTETRDYYIRMAFSSSVDGYAKSYVCKYDRQTQALLSREDCAYSSYFSDGLSTQGEIGSDEVYIHGNIKKQPPCSPTPETKQAALEYQHPNTRGEE